MQTYNNYLTTQINLAITELENDRRIVNPYLSTTLSNIKAEITTHTLTSAIKECKDFLYGIFAGAIIGGFIFSSDAHASPFNGLDLEFRIGIATPIGSQDIYKSQNKRWVTGDIAGNVELSVGCFSNKEIRCAVWHYSLITDNKDNGMSGVSILYVHKFNLTW